MFGSFCNYKNKKNTAYTLAEVLVVMSVIMLIILALPPVTKKVFKIKDTRKAHGRYECYWKVNETTGKKELWSYTAEENGREIETPLGASATYCEFKPTSNSIYFIMHAVGGGGAGAIVYTREIDNGDGTIDTVNVSDLEDKQPYVQAISYLMTSNPMPWPNWATWVDKVTLPKSSIPWDGKSRFDVGSVDTKQILRYRSSGSAGNIVSTFLPQLPGNVTLRLYPGKGGEISKANNGSGGDGEDTKIMYIYDGEAPIEGLVAKGGKGGNGDIDSRISYSLVGGPSTDFEISSKASIAGKKSGFNDVIESVEKYDMVQTKVPSNAGDSGSGETQYAKETDGQVYYEYDDNNGIGFNDRRIESDWKNITDKIKEAFFTRSNFSTEPNCELKTIDSSTPIIVKREGFCDWLTSDYTTLTYTCAIGKVPSAAISNINSVADPGPEADWKKFTVVIDYIYNAANNSFTYTNVDIKNAPTAYNPTNAKFYNCNFDTSLMKIYCYTQISNGKVYKCTKKGSSICSNGLEPKSRSKESTNYTNGTNEKQMKCPASGGSDGAVVILW